MPLFDKQFVLGATTGALLTCLLFRFIAVKAVTPEVRDKKKRDGKENKHRLSPGPTYRALCKHLYGNTDGPPDADRDGFKEDHSYPHTHLPVAFIESLLAALRPNFVLEVGSALGGSAVRIAAAALKATPEGSPTPCVLCIDSFLGDSGMWLDRCPGMRDWLMMEDGLPTFYYQFMANTRQFRDVILPFPLDSNNGLRALQILAIRKDMPLPDLVYLDAGHEKGETHLEIAKCFSLLPVGGVLLGDDLDWPAVEQDLRAFLASPEAAVTGADDEFLDGIPGVFFCSGGYWVVDCTPRQYLIRKSAGDLADLKKSVCAEEDGDEPKEYTPLNEADHAALAAYEEGLALSESGHFDAARRKFKAAAAGSESVAYHFQLHGWAL